MLDNTCSLGISMMNYFYSSHPWEKWKFAIYDSLHVWLSYFIQRRSFIHEVVQSFIKSFIHSWTRSFIHELVHSFTFTLVKKRDHERNTVVIEIQGEHLPNHWHPPPPTAQTPWPNWLIFWRVNPHVNTFRGTEAFFGFHPRSWDRSPKLAIFAYFRTPDLTPQY